MQGASSSAIPRIAEFLPESFHGLIDRFGNLLVGGLHRCHQVLCYGWCWIGGLPALNEPTSERVQFLIRALHPEELTPRNLSPFVSVAGSARQDPIPNRAASSPCRRLQVIQLTLPSLSSKLTTTIGTTAFEVCPERVELSLRWAGIDDLAECSFQVVLGFSKRHPRSDFRHGSSDFYRSLEQPCPG